jgi:hypothetical protein
VPEAVAGLATVKTLSPKPAYFYGALWGHILRWAEKAHKPQVSARRYPFSQFFTKTEII